MRVVRGDGSECAPGEVGEILVRGPNVTLGYWRAPDLTAAALRDGWYHTGDLGALDADDYLFVVLRWSIGKGIPLEGFKNLSRFLKRMYADPGVRAAVANEEDAFEQEPEAA